jgi:hypothetical protein
MGDTDIDAESYLRTQFDNMLVTASWFEAFRRQLGIDGVSQVWGERPAWYFWIRGAAGPYQLRLEDAEAQTGGGVQGIFSIRCYPYAGTAFYDGFSAEERGALESGLFDHTRTPRVETRAQIPDTLFNIAVFELVLQSGGSAQWATLESFDRMIVRNAGSGHGGEPVAADTGRRQVGDVIRNVHAWELAYPLFDRLVCLLVHYHRQKPLLIRMTRDSGFETVLDPPRPPSYRDTDTAGIYTLGIAFGAAGGDGVRMARLSDNSDRGRVVFEHHAACGHFHPPGTPVPLVGSLNPSWWSLADTRFASTLASTCGCEHDH